MKTFGIVALVLVIIMVVFTFALKACDQGSGLPTADAAQYTVAADNRLYYTNDYSQGVDKFGKYYNLNGYWYLSGQVWKHTEKTLYLSERGFSSVTVERR